MNINLSLETIISITGATLEPTISDKTCIIKKIASLETAGPEDMAVILDRGDASVFDSINIEKIKNCKASVILTGNTKDSSKDKTKLLTKDALTAFTKLVNYAQKNKCHKETVIAPSAIIGTGAVIYSGSIIGEQTNIGALCFVGHNCIIGENVVLYPGVKILDNCIIGDGTIIHAGTVIGSDGFGYEVTKNGLRKIPQIGIVVIGKMVEIGANCTIDRASFDKTVIGNMVKMDNGIHIAHNVFIGDGTAILAQTGIAGSAKIGIGCQIGGQVAIKNDTIIGNGVKIVSKSAVLNNIKEGQTVCGIPAMPFMQWKRLQVMISKLGGTQKQLSLWQNIKKLIGFHE